MTGSTGTPWKERARRLKREIYALTLASKDPRVPWYARLFIICLLGYAFSPLDLIPDFIPLMGLTDDFGVLVWVYSSVSTEIDKFLTWEKSIIVS